MSTPTPDPTQTAPSAAPASADDRQVDGRWTALDRPIQVLIVEDRPVARKLLGDELEQTGKVRVVGAAKDGEEAIRQVKALEPDVVLMDVVMPGMDGIQTTAEIRTFSNVPIILLTGAQVATDSLEHVARKRGADGFFLKPSGSVSVDLYQIREQLLAEIVRLADQGRT